jgi:hypothetical protein
VEVQHGGRMSKNAMSFLLQPSRHWRITIWLLLPMIFALS